MTVKLFQGDCLEVLNQVADNSVDLVLTDTPYGTTACKWDSVIPFEPMFKHIWRVLKPKGACLLFGSEPFSSALRMSQIKYFKYDWIWEKEKGANIAVLKYQPSKIHEIISIFSKKPHFYLPQMEKRPEKNKRKNKPRVNKVGIQGGKLFLTEHSKGNSDYKYPTSIKKFNTVRVRNGHPTQKPVPLLEYLIKTYTLEGETVLDFTMGSGSTGVAAVNLGRKFIGIELDNKYFKIAEDRIKGAV